MNIPMDDDDNDDNDNDTDNDSEDGNDDGNDENWVENEDGNHRADDEGVLEFSILKIDRCGHRTLMSLVAREPEIAVILASLMENDYLQTIQEQIWYGQEQWLELKLRLLLQDLTVAIPKPGGSTITEHLRRLRDHLHPQHHAEPEWDQLLERRALPLSHTTKIPGAPLEDVLGYYVQEIISRGFFVSKHLDEALWTDLAACCNIFHVIWNDEHDERLCQGAITGYVVCCEEAECAHRGSLFLAQMDDKRFPILMTYDEIQRRLDRIPEDRHEMPEQCG